MKKKNENNVTKYPKEKKKYSWVPFFLLAFGSAIMLFPFVWMILSSFKTTADVYTYPPKWLPSSYKLDNFKKVFNLIPFWLYYANSIFTSVVQTFLQIVLSITAAYAIAKLEFPGKGFLLSLIQSSMFIPAIVTMIPLFFLVSSMGLVDTYLGIILPQIFSAFTTMLIVSFFVSIPNDLIDAAKLDGCGYYRILTHVMIPNSKSAISTASLFAFLGHWRSYTWPLIVTNSTRLRTLPIGLKFLVQESSSEYQVMMAASLMAIVPVLIAYVIYEKQLVKSITLTGIK